MGTEVQYNRKSQVGETIQIITVMRQGFIMLFYYGERGTVFQGSGAITGLVIISNFKK